METKPKRFGIVPEFVLLRTDCFYLVQNLLPGPNRNDLFRWVRLGNELRRFGFIPVRCRNVCEMFVEHLFLYCFDIPSGGGGGRPFVPLGRGWGGEGTKCNYFWAQISLDFHGPPLPMALEMDFPASTVNHYVRSYYPPTFSRPNVFLYVSLVVGT